MTSPKTSEDTPQLELRNIHKVFKSDLLKKSQTAVSDLSCHFPKGACTGLMGHNGAGKTTSIRMIFGLLKPDKGEVLFEGRAIKRHDRSQIGYMPEVNKLPLNLTCEELLHYQLKLIQPQSLKTRVYKQRVTEKLKEVELWSHRSKRIGQLSKGMGRRLAWAQATIHQPKLLVLDEPFSGLDPLGRQLMSRLINSYRKEGQTIILCTHELWSVNEVCDHLHILHQGRLVFSSLNPGTEEVERPPQSPFELGVSGVSLKELEQLAEREQLSQPQNCEEYGYNLNFAFETYQQASAWLSLCLQRGILIRHFHRQPHFKEQDLLPYFAGDKSA